MTDQTPPKRGPHRWQKGKSPNPGGRPKRKPITDAMRAVWGMPMNRLARNGDTRTHGEGVRDRLYSIILYGEDKHAIAALKLLWVYLEGHPQQTVELQFQQALRDISARTGAPEDWLQKRAEQIAQRYLTETGGWEDTGGLAETGVEAPVPTIVTGQRRGQGGVRP